jgi:hypothetical protein
MEDLFAEGERIKQDLGRKKKMIAEKVEGENLRVISSSLLLTTRFTYPIPPPRYTL